MLLGAHAFFFRNGDAFTVPGAGTCGVASKPGPTDTGWIELGVIQECNISVASEKIPVWIPSSGSLRKSSTLVTKREIKVTIKVGQFGPFAIEMLFGTLALTSGSTQFNPLEGGNHVGWLKLQCYDQSDVQRLVVDLWVNLEVSGDVAFDGASLVSVTMEADVNHSTLNTGSLA